MMANPTQRLKKVSIEQTIQRLNEEYERVKNLEYIRNPVAYALYQTWKYVDKRNKEEEK